MDQIKTFVQHHFCISILLFLFCFVLYKLYFCDPEFPLLDIYNYFKWIQLKDIKNTLKLLTTTQICFMIVYPFLLILSNLLFSSRYFLNSLVLLTFGCILSCICHHFHCIDFDLLRKKNQ